MTYYAPADQIGQIDYAMKVGSEILPVFEKYYNVSYPLEKAGLFVFFTFPLSCFSREGGVYKRRVNKVTI